jgi:hypothetical protein
MMAVVRKTTSVNRSSALRTRKVYGGGKKKKSKHRKASSEVRIAA